MTEYRSEHTGKVVDDAVTQVKNNECKIKWGNILDSPSIDNQEDLWNTFLRVSGSNSITGVLRVSRATNIFMCAQRTDITKGTSPSTNAYWSLDFNDHVGTAAKDRLGNVGAVYFTNGSVRTDINVYKPEANSTVSTRISVGYNENGDQFTYAPTPAISDNSTQIATTEWVRSVSGAGLGIVHLSGDETITGNKTFSGATSFSGSVTAPTMTIGDSTTNVATTKFVHDGFVIKSGDTMTGNLALAKETPLIILRNSAMSASELPSDVQWTKCQFRDNTNSEFGFVGHRQDNDNSRRTVISCKNPSDSTKDTEIYVAYDASGNGYTYAPTPSEVDDNSNKIATTAWVKNCLFNSSNNVLSPFTSFKGTNLGSFTEGTKTIALNGSHSVYSMYSNGATSIIFSLPSVSTANRYNLHQILVFLRVGSTLPTINWGTTHFFHGIAPTITASTYYTVIYEYNSVTAVWVCGAIRKS